jgi:hypothetical protein
MLIATPAIGFRINSFIPSQYLEERQNNSLLGPMYPARTGHLMAGTLPFYGAIIIK